MLIASFAPADAVARRKATSEEAYKDTAIWYLTNNDAWHSWVTADAKDRITDAIAAAQITVK